MALTENNRYTTVNGPIKIEYVHVTSDGTDPDTIEARIQNPVTVNVRSVNTDLAGTADASSATVSGKTVSLHNTTNTEEYLVEILGF